MKRILLLFAWIPTTLVTLFLSLQTYIHLSEIKDLQYLIKAEANSFSKASSPFFAYAAIPRATEDIKTAILTGDARPVMINLYLDTFNSPMAGYGELILKTAEEYNVDPYLFVAIAQQESNLGKKMPDNCHNAWGYGMHSRGTLCFLSWEEGIDKVMKGLSENFLDKGLQTPEEIMQYYTPLSNGSWASGVNQFIEELHTGNF
jgi:hypothetical protein